MESAVRSDAEHGRDLRALEADLVSVWGRQGQYGRGEVFEPPPAGRARSAEKQLQDAVQHAIKPPRSVEERLRGGWKDPGVCGRQWERAVGLGGRLWEDAHAAWGRARRISAVLSLQEVLGMAAVLGGLIFFAALVVTDQPLPLVAGLRVVPSLREVAVWEGSSAMCSDAPMSAAEACEVVLARYDEPLAPFLAAFLRDQRHTVVNRGSPLTDQGVCERRDAMNVGREGHVYLQHILRTRTRPGGAAHLTLFCQADPAHGGYSVHRFVHDAKRLCSAPPAALDATPFTPLGAVMYAAHVGADEGTVSDMAAMARAHRDLFPGRHLTPNAPYAPGGCFAVGRHALDAVPTYRLGHALRMLGAENNPLSGQMLERSWPLMFNATRSSEGFRLCHDFCDLNIHK